jgi:hypothetical protein
MVAILRDGFCGLSKGLEESFSRSARSHDSEMESIVSRLSISLVSLSGLS